MEEHYLQKIRSITSGMSTTVTTVTTSSSGTTHTTCSKSTTTEICYNILILGPTGAGKSSFINSVFTALNKKYSNVVTVASTASPGIGTIGVDHVRMSENKYVGNIFFIDTKGMNLDAEGLTQEQLESVCRGKDLKNSTKEGTQNMPHCAIIVVNAKSLEHMNKRDDKTLKKQLKNIFDTVSRDTATLVVITHCDDIENDITNLYYSKRVLGIVEIAERVIGVSGESIAPVVNYHGVNGMELDTIKNMYLLAALYTAVKAADDRAKRMAS